MTGSGGMLGSAIAEIAATSPHFVPHALSHAELDVCDEAAVMNLADLVAGGWIVHCAAMAGAESRPAGSRIRSASMPSADSWVSMKPW